MRDPEGLPVETLPLNSSYRPQHFSAVALCTLAAEGPEQEQPRRLSAFYKSIIVATVTSPCKMTSHDAGQMDLG